jgi:23S rRNA (uracil1939-C5)-methyltransferase
MAETLGRYVVERARVLEPRTAVDAYSGAGQTAALLGEAGVAVTAIEVDPEASEWSSSILRPPSRAVQGRVEDILPSVLPADLVILNPPRAGVDARVTETLEANASHIRGVIYVSCNPATLARDVARLPGYGIEAIRAFDMFPHTAHVETVCELRPLTVTSAA